MSVLDKSCGYLPRVACNHCAAVIAGCLACVLAFRPRTTNASVVICLRVTILRMACFLLFQERLQADEVIQALDTQAVWGQSLSINPKDEL